MAAPAHHMLTANRLLDGDVVYWRAGSWVEAFADGEVFASEPDSAAALNAAKAFVAGNVVVNPYLFEVRDDNGVTVPVKEREIVRAAGPTVRRDLGKQATQKSQIRNQKSEATHRIVASQRPNLRGEGI
jgi:hypothetical protein